MLSSSFKAITVNLWGALTSRIGFWPVLPRQVANTMYNQIFLRVSTSWYMDHLLIKVSGARPGFPQIMVVGQVHGDCACTWILLPGMTLVVWIHLQWRPCRQLCVSNGDVTTPLLSQVCLWSLNILLVHIFACMSCPEQFFQQRQLKPFLAGVDARTVMWLWCQNFCVEWRY